MLLNYLLISLILLITKNHSFSLPHRKNYQTDNHRIHNKYNDNNHNHHHHQFDKLLNLQATNNITPDASKTSTTITTNDINNNEEEEYRKCLINTIGWVSAAAGFAGFIAIYKGIPSAIEFCSGYVLEQCLSIDNLFVILVIFNYFGIEKKYQEKPLKYGIYGAIVLRGLFIGLGSVAIQRFHYVLLLFAGVLLVSSYKILFSSGDDNEEDLADSVIVKLANKIIKTSDKLDEDNFFTVQDGVRMATPLLLCTICIELSDVVFAFDSVPAIFGVTEDPLIVFSSNIFAIAGLRSLFGVLSKAVTDLKYLEKAVGIILGIIAVKMGFETFDITILNPLQSLVVVISVLGMGVGLSLYSNNKSDKIDTSSSTISSSSNTDSSSSSSSNSNIVSKNQSFLQTLVVAMSVLGIGLGLSLYSNNNNNNNSGNNISSSSSSKNIESSSSSSNIVPKITPTEEKE